MWSPRSPAFVGLCAVALAVPLAVLGEAAGPYDDPKAWALPILVAATALAWLAGAPARPGAPDAAGDRAARVLRWTVIAYVSWWVITTVTSIAPGQSLLGNFGRGMGLLTVGSAALLFFFVRSECRTPEAVRLLVDAALLGSAPVCALALAQVVGWDPLPPAWDPSTAELRVRSTLGQHIFLGSYLAVLIPLAAARLWSRRESRRSLEVPTGARCGPLALGLGAAWVAGALGIVGLASHWAVAWWAIVPWGVLGAVALALAAGPSARAGRGAVGLALLWALLGAQALGLVLSQARGPLLGLLVGLGAVALLLLARRRAWRALSLGAAAAALILAALVLLNLPRSPLAPLAKMPVLHRLGELGEVSPGSPVWFRLEVWSGILSGWRHQLGGQEVISGTSPWVRSALGYGLETQLVTLERLALPSIGTLGARGAGWQAEYLVDRAHNALLDHLVTGGLVGAGLWLALAGALLAVGLARTRSGGPADLGVRVGAFAAVLAHLAEGQVGIETTAPLALFWITAGLLAAVPSSASASTSGSRPRVSPTRHARWIASLVLVVALGALIAWIGTRWLLASVAYGEGTRRGIAGQTREAYADFQRARALAPWLALPAEASAYAAMRLAGSEADPGRRLALLQEGEAALAEARRHAAAGAASWTLTAQLTFAEARAGDRSKLAASLAAFDAASRLRPNDAQLLGQWGWAWLESGDPTRARQAAEQALALPRGRRDWLSWAVLARSAGELGDAPEAKRAADAARRLAPPEARRALESVLR